jgi:hypothetical protein
MALLQENIVKVGKLFDNISIKHLAEFLKVEENMILEAMIPLFVDGIIPGKISLVDDLVVFKIEGMRWMLFLPYFAVLRIRCS